LFRKPGKSGRLFQYITGILESVDNVRDNFPDYIVRLYVDKSMLTISSESKFIADLDNFISILIKKEIVQIYLYNCESFSHEVEHFGTFGTLARFFPLFEENIEEVHMRDTDSTFGNTYDKNLIKKWMESGKKFYSYIVKNYKPAHFTNTKYKSDLDFSLLAATVGCKKEIGEKTILPIIVSDKKSILDQIFDICLEYSDENNNRCGYGVDEIALNYVLYPYMKNSIYFIDIIMIINFYLKESNYYNQFFGKISTLFNISKLENDYMNQVLKGREEKYAAIGFHALIEIAYAFAPFDDEKILKKYLKIIDPIIQHLNFTFGINMNSHQLFKIFQMFKMKDHDNIVKEILNNYKLAMNKLNLSLDLSDSNLINTVPIFIERYFIIIMPFSREFVLSLLDKDEISIHRLTIYKAQKCVGCFTVIKTFDDRDPCIYKNININSIPNIMMLSDIISFGQSQVFLGTSLSPKLDNRFVLKITDFDDKKVSNYFDVVNKFPNSEKLLSCRKIIVPNPISTKNILYRVFDHIEGKTMGEYIELDDITLEQKFILADKCLLYVKDVLGKNGYAHVDIHPDNIIIKKDTMDVYFIDFDLMLKFGESLKKYGKYFPPQENIDNSSQSEVKAEPQNLEYSEVPATKYITIDDRYDIYCLGITFVQLFSGEKLKKFKEKYVQQLLNSIAQEDIKEFVKKIIRPLNEIPKIEDITGGFQKIKNKYIKYSY